ncbi:Hypothetical protein SMAX5B_016501 [Scophthalmus maximus]|uniref:Uncharacterized protein n=1 Tax=Scophthalmus maximus TaxID=52904 RepID=A0A2U9C9P0_SCOMX|nr:Hypothetical protein SMAX5B_016501 [Scophthalmus maximus]
MSGGSTCQSSIDNSRHVTGRMWRERNRRRTRPHRRTLMWFEGCEYVDGILPSCWRDAREQNKARPASGSRTNQSCRAVTNQRRGSHNESRAR